MEMPGQDSMEINIRCSSLGGDGYDERHFAVFGEHHAAALHGYLPYGPTKARKLAEQRAKTLDFARAVLRVHKDTSIDHVRQLEEAEGRLLFQEYRTSVFAARQYLTGKKAAEVLRMLRSGELEADHELSAEDLGKAIEMAKVYDSIVHLAAKARRQAG